MKKNITWTEFQKQVKQWKKQFKGSLINYKINSYLSSERFKKITGKCSECTEESR